MRKTKDIETALYEQLISDGYSASAHALPASLGEKLPHIHVTRTGGYEQDMVIEVNSIDFDIYAEDAAEAMAEACDLSGWVRYLAGSFSYTSEIVTLPYDNPDPRHPNIGRATLKAQILTRVNED